MSAKIATSLALAGVLASATALLATPASAAKAKEMCFGVSLKGQNDCKAGAHDCKGLSTIDYDGQSFKLVPKGTCTHMKVDGHRGSLKPVSA